MWAVKWSPQFSNFLTKKKKKKNLTKIVDDLLRMLEYM